MITNQSDRTIRTSCHLRTPLERTYRSGEPGADPNPACSGHAHPPDLPSPHGKPARSTSLWPRLPLHRTSPRSASTDGRTRRPQWPAAR